MKLQIISIDQSDRWDNIVKSFKDYDVYYLSGYVKAFELHGDGEPMLFYFDNGSTRAINVAMKRDIAKDENFVGKIPENTYFDLSTPYGYGGFIIEGDDIKSLNDSYGEYCQKNNIISEFVRFNPVINNCRNAAETYETVCLGNTVCIDTTNDDIIWDNFISQNRNKIRKAKKSGLKVFWGRDEWLIDEFIKIYNETMKRDNATSYYYFNKEFYQSVFNDLKYNSMFFYTKLNDEIIAISIIMYCNNKMHYHLSASKKEYQHLAPTNLLLYECACFGASIGFKSLHLGGGVGCKDDSLYIFKKGFNRNGDKEFYIGKKIFNSDLYEHLLKIRESEASFNRETSFFPAYRG
ncbi:MAG: GNAT family N-acetyltransferase [Bacillota bacterium]|nr:GNAT family N-acetyltransferase [Bacillota bacterium]